MEISYKTYTIADLKAWLMENEKNGISAYSIDSCRAYAWINNPCALDSDPALVIVFNEKQSPIGYTGTFAETFVDGGIKGRFFWGSTEWLDPAYRGKGIASKMMHAIKEAVGYDKYLASDSSEASVRLDQKQGSKIQYYNRIKYRLYSGGTLKGKCYSAYVRCCNKKLLDKMMLLPYTNQYVTSIDKETFSFIKTHANNDLFLRQREMFNWMLHYPFLKPNGYDNHVEKSKCEFGSDVALYSNRAVKVLVEGELRGFYIISQIDRRKVLRYIYYEEQYKDSVFASVIVNLIKEDVDEIQFFSVPLYQYMSQMKVKRLNSKSIYDWVAFTSPKGLSYDQSLCLQGGDGDMFC